MISNSGTSTLGLYDFKRQIDAFGGVDYFRPTLAGGYLPNARVMLANGQIVQNGTSGNLTNDPNVDMTGWRLDDNTVESVADMLSIQNPVDGMTINVKGYYEATNFALAQPYKGGGCYIYIDSRKSENDDVLCINGWVLQVNGSLNLYQCGLKGDGLTDDRPALQKAVRVASKLKVKLIGNTFDVYLIASLQTVESRVDLIFCNTNYLDIDLNGATIKIANSLGDYRTIFGAGWVHSHFRITNGIIDQNTVNNPPQSPVLWSNTNGQRNIVAAYSVPHEYFEVSNIKMLDALGVWEINTTQAKRVYICNNEVHYSSVAVTHTDKTAFYVLPRQWAKVNENKFYGDTYGNATTAVELHGSNCEFKRNTVVGFRSPLFITPNAQEANDPVLRNICAIDNNFVSCQNGVLIWVESSANLNRPIENVHIRGNKVLIDSRLVTNKDLGITNGTGVGFLGSDEDCVIDGLYIQNNKINYNYNTENLKKDTQAGIDLTSFIPNAAFKWSNIYVQNNIVENAPCNGISVGNKAVGSHTSSIQNVTVSDNDVLNCGLGQVDNSFAVHIHNPSNLSKIKVHGNNFTETSDAGVTWMRFVAVDIGDGSEKTGVRFYDNDTSFSRDTSINDMYSINDVLVDDFRKNHLNHIDTNTKARIGSRFHDLNTGKIIVQSSLNADIPVWKEVTY